MKLLKKYIIIFICLFLFPLNAFAISARSAIVMDLNSGRILYENNSHEPHLIASITKIMTCLISIMYGNLDDDVTASDNILKAYGSSIYLEVGETMKLKDLLYGLMLRSGNDASLAIAKHVGTTEENFVYLMNEYAKTIGMKDTKFLNPHGLDNNGVGNISTAYDMALLTKVAMQNKTFREIFNTTKYTAKSSLKTYNWLGKNKLFSMYEYTTGGKTGYTESAHRTLVTTASKDNKNLVVVTLNDPNDFKDHKTLYETYFNKYDAILALDKTKFQVANNPYKNTNLYIKNNYYALLTKEEKNNLKLDITIYQNLTLTNNLKVGEVKVMLGDTLLHTENIYLEKIKFETSSKETLWQKIVRWFKSW